MKGISMFNLKNCFSLILIMGMVFGFSIQKVSADNNDWALLPFVKQNEVNPILKPKTDTTYKEPLTGNLVHWESGHIYNPTAIVKDDEVYLIYRAQSNDEPPSPSVLGLAKSRDGINFKRMFEYPILFPEHEYEKGGCEDPRVTILPDGKYLLMYTAYDGRVARLCSAISDDLIHWKKNGLVFKEDKFKNLWSKSGSLITEFKNNNFTAIPVKFENCFERKDSGKKFGMFWGDTGIFFAYASMEELRNGEWTMVLGENGYPKPVITPRAGLFDSRLCEPGPAAMDQNGKALLLYNGMNLQENQFGFCKELASDEYTPGQVQVETNNPFNVLNRLDKPFLKVTENYEKKGLVDNVVFIEGLVRFKGKYCLYYGCGDSLLAVAVCDKK